MFPVREHQLALTPSLDEEMLSYVLFCPRQKVLVSNQICDSLALHAADDPAEIDVVICPLSQVLKEKQIGRELGWHV